MPQGDKRSYTAKQKRQAEHIADGYRRSGTSAAEAKRRAWATVNDQDGGGKKSGSGRGQARKTSVKDPGRGPDERETPAGTTRTSRKEATPRKKAAAKKRAAPRKKTTARKKTAPRKKTAARTKTAPRKKTTARKKTAPRKKTTARKKTAKRASPAKRTSARR